ncbi:uncharacterized protein LOC119383934 isoform X1 [Rhipicephalus sanguineus]|uniref:uncharacterized protein LOC119383934 isoform X2 n=1 Tax=Rhipicephalus sanguineus TaxID=34632 RepID=UPI0020C538ED|nr:uncharacterized protein LOC119383934 isoform X2 [Rhipicephalus sanguineus]XP_049268675.1 uncharacterized protein LOC119383934 isoform X1 [Rhipicephalus sanguineus]
MERYAVGLQQYGLLPGDRICVHLNNGVENLLVMYGCILAGATVVLAKTSLTERELRYQAEDSDCTHIITDEQYAEKAKKAVSNMKMKALFCVGSANGFVSVTEFSKFDERGFRDCPMGDPSNSMLAVCYTSGTTGMPKGAEITHYNYVACCHTLWLHLPWGEGDVFFGALPITHQSGLVFPMAAMLDGATCALVSAKLTPREIVDAVDKYQATAALFFPTQLQAVVREMQRTGRGMPTVRAVVVGGSVLSASTAEAARKSFTGLKHLLNMYGMTESCGLVAGQSETGDIHTNGDVGFPGTGVQIKVVDVYTRQKLGPHETGEICFRSLSVVKGYYKRPKETAELFDKEGWCKTGDAGYYDESGRLYIVERLKQMIKCMDNQVVPAELEELLLRHYADEIEEVSVVGVPHPDLGEAPAAAIVLTEKGREQDLQSLAEKIKSTISTSLAVHKHLYGGVFFVDSFPKTETAKVNRTALARSLLKV